MLQCRCIVLLLILSAVRINLVMCDLSNLQAQAQECILEKSMTDSRKSSITAKVAAQIVEYYKLALKNLDASNCASFVGSKKMKVNWHCLSSLLICLTNFMLSLIN